MGLMSWFGNFFKGLTATDGYSKLPEKRKLSRLQSGTETKRKFIAKHSQQLTKAFDLAIQSGTLNKTITDELAFQLFETKQSHLPEISLRDFIQDFRPMERLVRLNNIYDKLEYLGYVTNRVAGQDVMAEYLRHGIVISL
jgi:hypothetical protein